MRRSDKERRYWFIQILVAFALFFTLAGDAIPRFFGGDDLENLVKYYQYPVGHWLMGLIRFWSSAYYRPLGGVVYLTLYRTFGFHALPFKIVLFCVLVLNMILCLAIARRLSQSMQVACWVLLLCSYHAAMNGLYLNFGTIYDVLGYSFFFGAFLAYITSFTPERNSPRAVVLIVVLYIAGLCCKEMDVTLPAVMLAYSVILSRALQSERLRWPLRSGLPVIGCSIIGVVYTMGKMSGAESLTANPSYTPHFTWAQYSTRTAHYVSQLFYLPDSMPAPLTAVLILVAMVLLALALRSGLMLFSALCVILTQLPVSFIGLRGAFVLYIALTFWALYFVALLNAATPLLKHPVPSLAGFVVVGAFLFAVNLKWKKVYDENFVPQNIAYREFSDQLDDWHVHLPDPGRVLLVNDPFPVNWIGWDPLFLLSLREAKTQAVANRMKFTDFAPPESELDWYDYVIGYDTSWRLLKSPGRHLSARAAGLTGKSPVQLLDGFEPPTRDGWRALHRNSSVEISVATSGQYTFTMSLDALDPVRLTMQLDDGPSLDRGAQESGDFQLAVAIPHAVAHHILHITANRADGSSAAPRLIFTTAGLAPQ